MADAFALRHRVARLFLEQLHVEVASFDDDLLKAGILDSLQFVELLMRLEKEFGFTVSIEDLEIDDFRSIERIAAYIASHQ
jgi:betaine-aldehyde dehydrogenase